MRIVRFWAKGRWANGRQSARIAPHRTWIYSIASRALLNG
jgi:hypothetical protein